MICLNCVRKMSCVSNCFSVCQTRNLGQCRASMAITRAPSIRCYNTGLCRGVPPYAFTPCASGYGPMHVDTIIRIYQYFQSTMFKETKPSSIIIWSNCFCSSTSRSAQETFFGSMNSPRWWLPTKENHTLIPLQPTPDEV